MGSEGPEKPQDFMGLEKTFRYLLYSRALRSVAIIYMALAMPLYLNALHMNLTTIGIVVASVMLFMIFESLLLGMLGDRYGYKKSIALGELINLSGAFIIGFTDAPLLIVVGMVIGGIGGAAGGVRGSFSPGSTALIASNWPEERERVRKLSLLTTTASFFSVIGGLLVSSLYYLEKVFGAIEAYKFLFLISGILLALSFTSILFVHERSRPVKTSRIVRKESLSYMFRIVAINGTSGAGLGLAYPLLPLWLVLMYHVSAAEVGYLFSASYLLTSFGAYSSFRLSQKFNALNMATASRILQGLFFAFIAFSPYFIIASLMFLVRAYVSGVGQPSRSAVNVRGISSEDYGAASSIMGTASRTGQLSSGLSGYLMDIYLPYPLVAGAILQIASGAMYAKMIKAQP